MPLKFVCPECGSVRVYYRISTQSMECLDCKNIWPARTTKLSNEIKEGGRS